MKNYPITLHASLLFVNNKIINWKIGTKSWENNGWYSSCQPVHLLINANDDDISVESFTKIVNNTEENNLFFNVTAREFFKMFDFHV